MNGEKKEIHLSNPSTTLSGEITNDTKDTATLKGRIWNNDIRKGKQEYAKFNKY